MIITAPRRAALAGLALLGLAGCATTADPQLTLADACDAFAASLDYAAARRAAGQLTPASIARIDAAIPLALPLCSAPPAGAAATTAAAQVAAAAGEIAAATLTREPHP